MLSGLAKTLLTATALAPVALCYTWVALMAGQAEIAFIIALFCCLLTMACNKILLVSKNYIETEILKINAATPADGEAVAMLLVYLLPLFTAKFIDLNWAMWVPALFIIGGLIGTGHCFNFNPLLRIMGWHFFNVQTPEGVGYVLVTKKKIKKAIDKKNDQEIPIEFKIIPLTAYLMVDIEE